MGIRYWNKLVRDRIPEIITATGEQAVTRTLNANELVPALKRKLIEEAQEVAAAEPPHAVVIELADVLEVVYALAAATGQSPSELEETRKTRAESRGTFDKRIQLLETHKK